MNSITHHQVSEWSFVSKKSYADPFNDVELNVEFTSEDGSELVVPAFWAGGGNWRVRFSWPSTGRFRYRTICSDASNPDLRGRAGEFEVVPYEGDNPLYLHGRLEVAPDGRHLQHQDGTPFFWLGDTWWMGLTKRMDWPGGFQTLAIDRVKKGFSVIQIVAGLYPDMAPFDERGANEAGFAWEADYARINPAHFDYADRRIAYLTQMGLLPCIVGCWGYFLRFMGAEKMKQHWRYLIARWGAYPVLWCLAGEGAMPYYMSENKDEDRAFQKAGWTEIARDVRKINPFKNLITIHPSDQGRNQVEDPSVLDFDMLQTGHGDRFSLPGTVNTIAEAYSREPRMPFINAEVCYEGIGETCRQEVQRLMFWVTMLGGAAGHTYGANGIWQVNTREKPFGPSPHGLSWGNTGWEDAHLLPGSEHLALAKRFLEKLEWWRLEPHPEWIEPRWNASDRLETYMAGYAAGIPGRLRVVYFPPGWTSTGTVKQIEKGARYRASLFDPVSGEVLDAGPVVPDENGDWEMPFGNRPWKFMPKMQDWVLLLEATG